MTTTTAPTTPRPVYFDCDTGIDDSLALAYLMASPAVRLVGVGTVAGNTNADQAARNSLELMALGGHGHVPVAVGPANTASTRSPAACRPCTATTAWATSTCRRQAAPRKTGPPSTC